jgi:hypothetical protein
MSSSVLLKTRGHSSRHARFGWDPPTGPHSTPLALDVTVPNYAGEQSAELELATQAETAFDWFEIA